MCPRTDTFGGLHTSNSCVPFLRILDHYLLLNQIGAFAHLGTGPKHKLQGRFLHITDIHPDPHYHPGMSEESACHRKKPKKSVRRSGEYGMAYRFLFSSIPVHNERTPYANLNLLFVNPLLS